MATLQKIRNHGVLLIVIVGLAMLAFILGDFLNSGSSFFNRSREYVGEIAGHKVHYTEYEAAKEQLNDVYKIETGRSDFDEDLAAQLRNQVWSMMLLDWTLRAECEKIGMDVTADELSELCIGENPHAIVRQRRPFMDENGQFSREGLIRFLHSIEQESENAEMAANIKQAKSYWLYWENAVRLTHMQDKYSNLVKCLVKGNPIDAKYAFMARQNSVDVEYIAQSYYDIADSLVKVNASDIKRLYKQNMPLYKQEPNRGIEYIAFNIVPSENDYAAAEQEMKDVEEEFRNSEDIATVVNTHSDIMYSGANLREEQVPEMYRAFAFAKGAKKDDFSPIQFVDGTYSMARLVDCGYSMPDSVCLKLIAVEEGQEDTELGWYEERELNREMAEKAFACKRGGRFTMASGLNEQTFEVLDIAKATPKVKLAIIARNVTPSSKTYSVIYNQAKQFIVANNNEEALRAAAKENNMTLYPAYNLNKNTDKVAQLKNSRPIVRWAFEAKDGQVSDVFECGDQFIVAMLTEVHDGEYRDVSEVRGELTVRALNEKKAAMMTKNLQGSLEEAAAAAGVQIQKAEGVKLGDYRFGIMGNEPKVIGTALAMGDNQTSKVIAGNAGVYVIRTGVHHVAEGEFNVNEEIANINARHMYTLPYQAISLLNDNAKVVDNRANFQ